MRYVEGNVHDSGNGKRGLKWGGVGIWYLECVEYLRLFLICTALILTPSFRREKQDVVMYLPRSAKWTTSTP